jgi:hypothetical protein
MKEFVAFALVVAASCVAGFTVGWNAGICYSIANPQPPAAIAKTVTCPICGKTAGIVEVGEYAIEYRCDAHSIAVLRYNSSSLKAGEIREVKEIPHPRRFPVPPGIPPGLGDK